MEAWGCCNGATFEMNRCQKRKERENRENKGAEISLMGYMKLWHNNARTQCVGELETRFEREGRRKICDENNEKQLYFFRLLRLLWSLADTQNRNTNRNSRKLVSCGYCLALGRHNRLISRSRTFIFGCAACSLLNANRIMILG